MAALRAGQRPPSGASISSGVPGPDNAIGSHTYPMFRASRGDQIRTVTVPSVFSKNGERRYHGPK